MKYKLVGIIIYMLLMGTVFSATGNIITVQSPLVNINGRTLYVGGYGPHNFSRISDAIEEAKVGDTVYVYDYSSPYYENLKIDKSINLIGENRHTTIIFGDSKNNVVQITADNVIFKNFTITDYNNSGILLSKVSGCLIQDNIVFHENITDITVGIKLDWHSSLNNITGNEVYGFYDGINIVLSNFNIIHDNYVHHNKYAINNLADNTKIIYNFVTENEHRGISNAQGRNNLISDNIVTNNGFNEYSLGGIWLSTNQWRDGNNYITNNFISNNSGSGIYVSSWFGSLVRYYISNNVITKNKLFGIYSDLGFRTIITKNNLIENAKNAYFRSWFFFRKNTFWNKNYWSDYTDVISYKIKGEIGMIIMVPWYAYDRQPVLEPYTL